MGRKADSTHFFLSNLLISMDEEETIKRLLEEELIEIATPQEYEAGTSYDKPIKPLN